MFVGGISVAVSVAVFVGGTRVKVGVAVRVLVGVRVNVAEGGTSVDVFVESERVSVTTIISGGEVATPIAFGVPVAQSRIAAQRISGAKICPKQANKPMSTPTSVKTF